MLLSCGEFPFALENTNNFLENLGVKDITLTHNSAELVARNIFMLKVISNDGFDLENPENIVKREVNHTFTPKMQTQDTKEHER